MAVGYLEVNTGTVANDGSGDSIRAGMVKVNSNFSGLYTHRSVAYTTPTGNATPSWIGEELLTTISGYNWWKSISLSPTGWVLLTQASYGSEDYGTVP